MAIVSTVRVSKKKNFDGGTRDMSTLAVVEEILRETAVPMSVREIVERAGVRLPSKSKTPDTVVARDLSMDIKKKGETSIFIRTSPGRYTLRALATAATPASVTLPASEVARTVSAAPTAAPGTSGTTSMSALPQRKPAVAATTTPRPRTDSEATGGGLVS
ncbi:MAG TPA: HTH domain-containing protein [Kofleriaceae bacterium]|nr:HTH domain-containing protein [Kofleriaceae bacterium]